jgi:acetyl-CoA acetyltransferase
MLPRNETAIVGIGWTAFSRNSQASARSLAAEASFKAIDDAGLKPRDIDGVMSWFHRNSDGIAPKDLGAALSLDTPFALYVDAGGHWMCGAVTTAASLVASGVCQNVLLYVARNSYSEGRGRRPADSSTGGGRDQFSNPFGQHLAATTFAMPATAHMARFGTTTLDFAHLAVTQRKHASLNRKAQMQKPITIEDHQNSRWISYPYRLLDCCQQTDGAVAIVITSAERARNLRHRPVYIMAGVAGEGPTSELWATNGVNIAPRLYEAAGVTPRDVDVAELYDPFTGMVMLHMEDFGLVPKGEVGGWVTAGKNGLDGETPVNTHGGLLNEAHMIALNHVVEAVQQLRPEGVVDDLCDGPHTYDRSTCRQVRDPEIALLCGESGGSGMLLRKG